MALTQVDQGLLSSTAQYTGFKNRIINGAMMIDQRNAGASVTHSGGANLYTLDRWVCNSNGTPQFSIQQVADAPSGFKYSAKLTTTTSGTPASTDFSYFGQYVEGLNVADLGFGTASAATVTISFWVKSSLTGTFSGALKNTGNTRAYPFSYSISSANTWEQKSVTIAGDTTGTWNTDNTVGMSILFDTGSGSNNKGTAGAWNSSANIGVTGAVNLVATSSATWQVTGVQLEKGSTATSFDYRPYGTELALCQRYYEKSYAMATVPGTSTAYTAGMSSVTNGYSSSAYIFTNTYFRVAKRASATMAYWDAAGNASRTTYLTGGGLSQVDNNNVVYSFTGNEEMALMNLLGTPSYNYCFHWTASAEL